METQTRVTNVEELRSPDAPSIREMLQHDIDIRHLRQRKQGNITLDYFSVWTLLKCLINRAPNGYRWEIVDVSQIGDYVVVKGRLCVFDEEGLEMVTEAVSSERLDSKGAPPVETASSSCFRRACAMQGLGLSAYLDH